MACRLFYAGCGYVDTCREDPPLAIDDMPAVVQPFARRRQWMDAYERAAMRLVKRLEKGLQPNPNCTGTSKSLVQVELAVTVAWLGDAAQYCCGWRL
jgi:hypothetical protein